MIVEIHEFLIASLQSMANLFSVSVVSKLRSLANLRTALPMKENLSYSTALSQESPYYLIHYLACDVNGWYLAWSARWKSPAFTNCDDITCISFNIQDAPQNMMENVDNSSLNSDSEARGIIAICWSMFQQGMEEVMNNLCRKVTSCFKFARHTKLRFPRLISMKCEIPHESPLLRRFYGTITLAQVLS